jgi:hypothetical protein
VKVRFTPSARTQFLAAIEYIYRKNPTAATAFRHKSEKSLPDEQLYELFGASITEVWKM